MVTSNLNQPQHFCFLGIVDQSGRLLATLGCERSLPSVWHPKLHWAQTRHPKCFSVLAYSIICWGSHGSFSNYMKKLNPKDSFHATGISPIFCRLATHRYCSLEIATKLFKRCQPLQAGINWDTAPESLYSLGLCRL